MLKVKVTPMVSNSGRDVANQFVVNTPEGAYFQSFRSMIAFKSHDGQVFLDPTYWDYSPTTGKYRNQFLGEPIADTRKKIESGEYAFMDLN